MAARGIARSLSAAERRWLLVNAVIGAALVNAILNTLIAWLSAANVDRVPLSATPLIDGPSTITDTVGTLFILPLITTALITAAVRREVRDGKLVLSPETASRPLPGWLPHGTLARGATFGALCMAILGPPAVGVLVALDYGDISVDEFVIYKAIFGVVLGALVTPPIALTAFASQARSTA